MWRALVWSPHSLEVTHKGPALMWFLDSPQKHMTTGCVFLPTNWGKNIYNYVGLPKFSQVRLIFQICLSGKKRPKNINFYCQDNVSS